MTDPAPRITFVVTRADDLGGAQVHVRDVSLALAAHGWDVHVLAGSRGPLSEALEHERITFQSLPHLVRPVRPGEDLRAGREIRTALREIGPDLVSLHSSKAGILGRLGAVGLGVPVLFTAHGWGFSSSTNSLTRRTFRLMERAMAPLADRIIAVSEADRELALKYRLATPSQVVAVHNGMPDVPPTLRARPADEPPHLVMVARFAPPKDHTLLVEALSDLQELDWHLSFVGDGPQEPEIRALVQRRGLEARISFLGFRKDVAELLAAAQAFILVSRSEAFPRSILEATRAGLPTIASDVGGIRESVLTERTGFVVPGGDREALREHLRVLLREPTLRSTMGDQARDLYEAKFTFDRMLARTVGVYESLLGRPLPLSASSGWSRVEGDPTELT